MLNFSKSALAFLLCIVLLLSTYSPASALDKSMPTRRSIKTTGGQDVFKNRASQELPLQPAKQTSTANTGTETPELALLKLLRLERELNNRMEKHNTSMSNHLTKLNKLLSDIENLLASEISTLSDIEASVQVLDVNIDTTKLTQLYAQFEENIKSSSDNKVVTKSIKKATEILHEMAGEKMELEAWMVKFNAKVVEEGRKADVEKGKGNTPTGSSEREELRR